MSARMPKECEKVREQLPEFADGTLVGAARLAIERHLETCARCAAELADLRVVISAAHAVPQEEPPEHLAERVADAVRGRAPAAPQQFWLRLAVPAAVLTGVLAVTFALRGPYQPKLARRQMVPAVSQERVGSSERAAARSEFAPGVGAMHLDSVERAKAEAQSEPMPAGEDEIQASRHLGGMGLSQREEEEGATRVRRSRGGRGAGAADYAPSPEQPRVRSQNLYAGEERAEDITDSYFGRDQAAVPEAAAEEKAASPRLQREVERLTVMGAPSAAVSSPPPPVSTTISVVKTGSGENLLALQLGGTTPIRELSVQVGDTPATTHQWLGEAGRPALIPLPAERIGTGPAATPVTVMTDKGKGEYVLFVPTLARLGEAAPQAPAGRWQDTEISQALFDLSMFTGLVILAEEPLSARLSGDIPTGTPAEVLQQLATEAGFEVHREGAVAYSLTHLR